MHVVPATLLRDRRGSGVRYRPVALAFWSREELEGVSLRRLEGAVAMLTEGGLSMCVSGALDSSDLGLWPREHSAQRQGKGWVATRLNTDRRRGEARRDETSVRQLERNQRPRLAGWEGGGDFPTENEKSGRSKRSPRGSFDQTVSALGGIIRDSWEGEEELWCLISKGLCCEGSKSWLSLPFLLSCADDFPNKEEGSLIRASQ